MVWYENISVPLTSDQNCLVLVPRCDHRRSLFHQSLVIKEGYLKKCHRNAVWIPKPFSFKKRYCWLSTENLLYGRTVESAVCNLAVDTEFYYTDMSVIL